MGGWGVVGVEAESTWSENLRSSAAPPSGRKREGGLESGVDEGERGACWVLSRNIYTSQFKKYKLFCALLHFCVAEHFR